MLVWNSSNTDFCAQTLANIFLCHRNQKGEKWLGEIRPYRKYARELPEQNYMKHTSVLFNCSIVQPLLFILSLFHLLFHFDQHCVVGRTWPLLEAYWIWAVLPILCNRYGESIRELQDCDRKAPIPAPRISKRMSLWQWVSLLLPRAYLGQITWMA